MQHLESSVHIGKPNGNNMQKTMDDGIALWFVGLKGWGSSFVGVRLRFSVSCHVLSSLFGRLINLLCEGR